MLLQVLKEWDYEQESNSSKSGIDGMRSTPCAQLILIKASKNHLLATFSYKFKMSEIMRESQIIANQEAKERPQGRPHK